MAGVRDGKRGHADASAVGAGKTLTALATSVRLAALLEEAGVERSGILIMLPTKALIKEWLLQVAAHTTGFHVIEQREDGQLFSLTYGRAHAPVDGNALVISTLDRVCRHPFVKQAVWDFVVIDECLSVQNAAAKRNPSAWRQIEVSACGVLMLSATFFRSKFDSLFYMIRMLRSPLPRLMEWLPATIHEHIVCQVPETDRTWQLRMEPVILPPPDLNRYRAIVEAFKRKQLSGRGNADGRKLWGDLECFLREKYEGRVTRTSYNQTSIMGEAFAKAAKGLLQKGKRPLVFADTSHEAEFLLGVLRAEGLEARTWASLASERVASSSRGDGGRGPTGGAQGGVLVAVKSVEGQGINMQGHADAIVCRPTPGDHLEQMKGRIDRPGQTTKGLLLVVVVAEHTIEEAKYANIRLAGNFFREYIAPIALRYREQIDLEATLAAGGKAKLRSGTVSGVWRRSLEAAGQSGAFASVSDGNGDSKVGEQPSKKKRKIIHDEIVPYEIVDRHDIKKKNKKTALADSADAEKSTNAPKYLPINKVIRNKGDPEAVRQAKIIAKSGHASLAVRRWLFPPKETKSSAGLGGKRKGKPLPKESLLRFSDQSPPLVLDRKTIVTAVDHLSKKDPKLAALIARVGADALVHDCGDPKPPTQARLFDRCVRAITFTMVSVDAGNAFLRRLAMKIGVCLEHMEPACRKRLLGGAMCESGGELRDTSHVAGPDVLLQLLLGGSHSTVLFTPRLVGELVGTCEVIGGRQTGYPHLCGVSYPCGKNDGHEIFLGKARAHVGSGGVPVSAGYSAPKASFLVSLVHDFDIGKISGRKMAEASDREAARMLMDLKGIGDWCAGGVLMHFLSRADVMLYGDLTIRNYLNDLYDIGHQDSSETLLESAADFADTGPNRNLIDAVAKKNNWEPYRSVVCYLMYHLQEENLVLL